MSSIKKIKSIVDRIIRKHATGIIYNVPVNDQAILISTVIEKYNNITIKGSSAYTSRMLQDRLGQALEIRNFSWNMLPACEDKLITIYEADLIKPSYNKVLKDFYEYHIPVLLIMNGGSGMQNFRKLDAYRTVLTLEQDYKNL